MARRAAWWRRPGGRSFDFVSQCAVCRRWPGAVLCAACLERHAAPMRRCRRCAIGLPHGLRHGLAASLPVCGACLREPPPLSAAVAAVDYGHPWDRLIARYKFHDAVGLAGPLAALLAERLIATPDLPAPDLILPVPLTAERLRERGYNQAWELARRLGRRFDRPASADLLLRLVGGAHQAALHGDERRRQVHGAFALAPGAAARVAGRTVALVDDVMTTGATLHELARTLQRAGAHEVQAWVLARTPA